ncbi:MAG TPA: type II toxin-antitoxin system RelE/ParE family toxin [Caulobacteraceae bacterium]|nr:type II toxin-antitoxin system RelE/ParE family toxin [Caulobacteraceae bacterium]
MNLVWSAHALDDRIAHFRYIASDSFAAAAKVDDAMEAATQQLVDFPESGRPGRVSGVRELVVPGMPYVIVYATQGDVVRILRVLHGAQQWPDGLTR